MKVKLNKEKLQQCLSYTSKIIEGGRKGGISPLYTQIQFDFVDNILKLTSYDSAYGIQATYGEVTHPDGRYLIDLEGCNHIIKFSDSTDIEFDFKEKQVIVTDEGSKYKFVYYDAQGSDLAHIFTLFSRLPEPILKTNSIEFQQIYKFLSPCIANDAARPFLNGLLYDGNFIATDGNICGVVNHVEPLTESIFLVDGGLSLIAGLPQDKDILIYGAGNLTVVTCDNIMLVMPQVNGAFPTYSKVITATSIYPYDFVAKRSQFEKICRKLIPFADKHQRLATTLVFSSYGTTTLTANSEGSKEGVEILGTVEQSVNPNEEKKFCVNIKILADVIGALPGEILHIKYSDNQRAPLVLSDNDKFNNYFSVYSFIEKV